MRIGITMSRYVAAAVLLVCCVHMITASVVHMANNEQEKDELISSLEERTPDKARIFGLIYRTTTYSTYTTTSTLSTASICALKTYKCGTKRKRRFAVASDINVRQLHNEDAEMLDFFDDNKIKEVVKRSADDLNLNLHDYHVGRWIPSPAMLQEEEQAEEQAIPVAAPREEVIHEEKGRLFNMITVQATSTTTTTSTTTSTIGTVGITGTTAGCAGASSITDFFSVC